jgi:hypothetical protein
LFRRWTIRDGKAIPAVEDRCETCGPIHITAGTYRKVQNPSKFVRWLSTDPESERDWRLGNSLTYHDPISRSYGRARYAHNEGFYGSLSRRWRLIDQKRWFRRRSQVEMNFYGVFSIMHVLAMEQRRRAAQQATATAPPPALAA